jgi:hypothetical protein
MVDMKGRSIDWGRVAKEAVSILEGAGNSAFLRANMPIFRVSQQLVVAGDNDLSMESGGCSDDPIGGIGRGRTWQRG